MPTKCGRKDSKGYFCAWGNSGHHYYYTPGDEASKNAARKKADAQGAAAYANGYEGSEKSVDILEEKKPKVPNPDEPGEEANPGDETEEWKKSYKVPESLDELSEGHIVKYNNKVGKIRKILNV